MHHSWRLWAPVILLLLAVGCAADGGSGTSLPEGVDVDVTEPLTLNEGVRVIQGDSALLDVTLEADGRLRFHYVGAPELDFAAGDMIVGNEGPGYMGRVLTIDADGDDRLVSLEPVGLDEIIAEGAFSVHMTPDQSEFVEVTDEVGGRSDALGGNFDLIPAEVLDGAGVCEGMGAASVRLTHHLETRGIDTDFVFEKSGFSVRKAGVTVTGGATLTLVLETSGTIDVACAADIIDYLNRRGVGIRPVRWEKRFTIAGILPVSVKFTLTPQLLTDAHITVEPTTMSTTVRVAVDLTAGVLYERGSGISFDTGLDRDVDFDMDIEDGGHAEAAANLHAGLYMDLDINLLKLPRAGAELDASASFTTDDLACTYDWNASVSGSVYLRGDLGVDLGFFSHTFATLNESIGFSAEASGDGGVSLPYCSEDMCMTDADCFMDETCTDGICVENPECTVDADCAGSEVCSAGSCVPGAGLTCDECALMPGFGFCIATGECVPEGEASSCSGDFSTSRSGCMPCEHTDCGSCAGDGFCGWISSEGRCVNDAIHRDSVPASDYISTPSWCS